jgi:hypothetical protein
MTTISIDGAPLDRIMSDLREHAASWTAVPLTERIALLERMLPRVAAGAADMAAAGSRAKGLAAGSAWSAEDWFSGPWALAQNIQAYLHVLRRIAASEDPVAASAVNERDGRTYVDVLPATWWDALLLNGFSAQVWLRPGTTAEQARARRQPVPAPGRIPRSRRCARRGERRRDHPAGHLAQAVRRRPGRGGQDEPGQRLPAPALGADLHRIRAAQLGQVH